MTTERRARFLQLLSECEQDLSYAIQIGDRAAELTQRNRRWSLLRVLNRDEKADEPTVVSGGEAA